MTNDMTKGKPLKLILSFAIPLLIGNFFQQLYNMADTFIVGRFVDVKALAALGSIGGLSFLILGFAMGITTGLSIPVSRYFGANNEKGVKKSFAVAIFITVIVSIFLTIISVLFCYPILILLQTPNDIIHYAYEYIVVIFAGITITMFYNLFNSIIRALGDSKTPLYFLIVACFINIGLDILFIYNFNMGVFGAAFATIISQAISVILCVIYIYKKLMILYIKKEHFKNIKENVFSTFRFALPMGFQFSLVAIGAIILQYTINNLGTSAVAAYTAAGKIESIAIFVLASFGITMSTYTAQNLGAKKYQRILDGVKTCFKLSLCVSIVLGIVLFMFAPYLISMFVGNHNQELIDLGSSYFRISTPVYPLLGVLFLLRNTLQGSGDSFTPTLAGIMELVMRAGVGIMLSVPYGFFGISFANPLAWIGAVIPLTVMYYRFTMKIKKEKTNNE